MIFRMVALPDPLAPRMIFLWPAPRSKLTSFNTTLSSKASCTWSKATTGWSPFFGGRRAFIAAVASCSISINQRNHHSRDEEIHRDDADRSDDNGLRRRNADSLGASDRPQPDVAGDADDDEAQDERLHQAHPDILHVERLPDRRPVK